MGNINGIVYQWYGLIKAGFCLQIMAGDLFWRVGEKTKWYRRSAEYDFIFNIPVAYEFVGVYRVLWAGGREGYQETGEGRSGHWPLSRQVLVGSMVAMRLDNIIFRGITHQVGDIPAGNVQCWQIDKNCSVFESEISFPEIRRIVQRQDKLESLDWILP